MSSNSESLEDYRHARRDELTRLSREERDVIRRELTRRGFVGATAAATLAALVGRQPRLLQAAGQAAHPAAGPRPEATADAVIVLWMAGGMASTETFDPKRYTRSRRACRSRTC